MAVNGIERLAQWRAEQQEDVKFPADWALWTFLVSVEPGDLTRAERRMYAAAAGVAA